MSTSDFGNAPNSKNRVGTPSAHRLRAGWTPKARTVARWAERLGITPSEVIETYLAPFKLIASGRSFMYRNWDAAFASCIRSDWLGVRGGEVWDE